MTQILIAEDDKFLANAYRVKLELEGYAVIIASDGQEALSILAKNIPDLILLDLVMPNLDGFETLKQIKQNPKFKNIPIIITSNLSQESDYQKVKALGINDYLVKSDTPLSTLISKIKLYVK